MKLTKNQLTELSDIFHNHSNCYAAGDDEWTPCVTFDKAVRIFEEFLSKSPIDWQPGAPSSAGRYFLMTEQVPFPHDYYPYDPDDAEWGTDKVLFHFGPIPPAPKIDRI